LNEVEPHHNTGVLSGVNTLFLCVLLLTLLPVSGYIDYPHRHQVTCQVEQVISPFLNNMVTVDYQSIQSAVSQSVTVGLRLQGNQFLSLRKASNPLFRLQYYSDDQDGDDIEC
jgi:hypothetical protein